LTLFISPEHSESAQRNGFSIEDPLIPLEEILGGGLPRDGIPSIDSPKIILAAEADCLLQLDSMLNAFGDTPTFLIWENHFFTTKADHDVEKLEAYQKNKEKIFAVVKMTKRDILFESALEKMTKSKQIFGDVNMDPEYNILEKSRLHKIKTDYWDMLDIVIPTQSTKKEGNK